MDQIKRGDPFAFFMDFKDADDNLILDISAVKCQIRTTAYQLVCDTIVTGPDAEGKYLIQAPETDTWPIGQLIYDVRFKVGGVPKSSTTTTIDVVKEVTRYE